MGTINLAKNKMEVEQLVSHEVVDKHYDLGT